MNTMKKVLLVLLATEANAAMPLTLVFGGNVGVALRKTKIASDGLVNRTDLPTNPAVTNGSVTVTGTKTELKDPKKVFPTSVNVFGRALFGNEFKFGAGLAVGGRYNFGLPTDGYFGDAKADAVKVPVTTGPDHYAISFKHPKGSVALNPHLLACFGVNDLVFAVHAGLDLSYMSFEVDYATGKTAPLPKHVKVSGWAIGAKLGVEAMYQLTPMIGVGVGLDVTYWPSGMSFFKQKGKKAEFTTGTVGDKKEEVLNVGGTWSVGFNVGGCFTNKAADM